MGKAAVRRRRWLEVGGEGVSERGGARGERRGRRSRIGVCEGGEVMAGRGVVGRAES